ncbi:MAG: endonuclease III [Candidatus Omnitrophota bacterium]
MGSSDGDFKILSIAKLLRKSFGRRKFNRERDPIGELIRTILSQNTSDRNSVRAYDNLRRRFKNWDRLRKARVEQIKREIKIAGLANIKAPRIKGALDEIERRCGSLNLNFLSGLDVRLGYRFLRSIKGVGPKTAACVLLFSFRKPMMPVDTHIFRVTKRLGILDRKAAREEAQEYFSEIVPKDLIYEFHLNVITLGRQVCIARYPRCRICNLKRLCKYYRERYGR